MSIQHTRTSRRNFVGGAAALAGLAAFGCAPGTPSAPGPSSSGQAAPAPAPDRSAQATINLAVTGVAKGIVDVEGITNRNQPEIRSLCHCPLSQYDHDYNVIPVLAERIPSIDDGTWAINPDGTMRMTWHLRKNAKWHDGRPFTSRDVRFSWEFVNDRSLPTIRRPIHTNVTAMDLPDDNTVVMHWRVSNNLANVMTLSDLFIYPEHIVRPLWEAGEGDRMLTQEFFHDGFVGLGAYRLERRTPEDGLVYKPFDEFFLGRPKIGNVVMHQLESSTQILTRLLAGELQMANSYGLEFGDGLIAQEQWEAKGEGKVHWTPVSLQRLVFPLENPMFRDPRVRKALLLSINRDEMLQTFFHGQVIMAHSLLHPSEPGYKTADPIITKYGFDPRQALALMEQAGWQRGSDGVLANAAGERFELTYRVPNSNQEYQQIQGAVANYWKDIGVRSNFDNVALRVAEDSQERATFNGVQHLGGSTTVAALFRRWHSTFIPNASNRFIGDNLARWANPEADRLLEQLERSFTLNEIEQVLAQLGKVYTDDMPALPLYYQAEPVAVHRNLRNARPRPNSSGQHATTWDAHLWEWGG
jgi:peptide/nickel transport system substrate-binding protein